VSRLSSPFRADHVGSALRPKELVEARERCQDRQISKPLENMCLGPQCGFASTVHGNAITQANQWAKLELVVNTAREIWGD